MRKSLVLFLIIGGVVLGVGIFNSLLKTNAIHPPSLEASGTAVPESILGIAPSPSPDPVTEPLTFSIPSLGIQNAAVESVGLDKEGKMDIPKKDENVAWYNLGAKPGEVGNAVLAGHLDTKSGSPAVFYNISKLKPGDELQVKSKDGKEYKYSVTSVERYELAEFPLIEVFGAGDKPRLNLITCEGNYDKDSRLYSHRLVVYSELKS